MGETNVKVGCGVLVILAIREIPVKAGNDENIFFETAEGLFLKKNFKNL